MQEPLKVAICEDTPADAEKLAAVLSACSIPVEYTMFSDGESLLAVYRPHRFDLILADILLGENGPTGIETVAQIRTIDREIPVAFITTSLDYTLESYRLSALKYIEKPIRPGDIEDILSLAQMKKNNIPSLCVHHSRREEKIPFSDILYLEQQKHQLHIVKKDGEVVQIYERLSLLLPQLETQPFFSPHKSYSVNLAFVRFIDADLKCFVMQDGSNIPIRRESMSHAKKALETFLFNRTRRLSP